MKFLEKLNQLKQKKKNNLIEVIVTYENFSYLDKYDLFDVTKKDDLIYLKIKYIDYYKLKKTNVFEKSNNKLQSYFIINKMKVFVSAILLFCIFIFFILNQLFIRKIEFKDNKYYNNEIYETVINNSKKIGKIYYLKKSINEISKELREKYYHYAYIGLIRKGSKILIEIEIQTINEETVNDSKLFGELISKADGVIQNVKIESGNVLVKYKDVVKKDQLLVTSNLLYNENLFNKDKMVPLRGYIIAITNEYKKITVLKEEQIEYVSNLNNKKYYFTFKNDNNYVVNNKLIKVYNIFKIGNFSLKKKLMFNVDTINVKRNLNDALEYANYLIYIEYINKFIYEEEKILSINNISVEENENEFIFNFLVSAKQNIAIFNNKN